MANNGRNGTHSKLEEILDRRIMVLDGSMGALIYSYKLTEEDVRGSRFANHPVGPEELHRGPRPDAAEADRGDPPRLPRGRGRHHRDRHLQRHGRVARGVRPPGAGPRAEHDAPPRSPGTRPTSTPGKNPDKPRFVAGGIGPTKKQLSMGIHVEDPGRARRDLRRDGRQVQGRRSKALVEGGVDLLLPETSFDTLVLKACLFAIDSYFEETGTRLPVMISGTIFDNHRTLSAQPVEAFYYSVSHFDALSVGLNCAVGRRADAGLDREPGGASARTRISCYPNAGMPDGFGGFQGDKDEHGRACWASSPATAGSTSSAAAAAPRPTGSRPSRRPSRAWRRGRCRTCRTGRA